MEPTDAPPDWTHGKDSTLFLSSVRSIDGWDVEARWWGEKADVMAGPRQVVITLADNASPVVRARGFNTGVMRRAEGVIGDLIHELFNTPLDATPKTTFLEAVAGRVSQLPEGGPRSRTGDYYGALLTLYDELAVVSDEPASILAKAMGKPRSTVKSQIKRARDLRQDGLANG